MVYRALINADEGDLLTGTRVCRTCSKRQPMTAFYWASGRKCRVRECSTCKVDAERERRHENRERVARASFLKNLRINYGMTEADYLALLAAQANACAICREEFGDQTPQVDHDHETGAVRGLLCFGCNSGIGKLGDSAGRLRAAADYLERPPPAITGRPRYLSRDELRAIRSAAATKQHATPEGRAHLAARPAGERNPAARLTDAQVVEIRQRYQRGGVTQRDLADEFGCSQSLVSRIVLGKLRSDLEIAA